MLVLDTDHMSLLEWGGRESAPLRERLADVAADEVVTTVISFEEQMRGWMAYITRAKAIVQQVDAYARLRRHSRQARRGRGTGQPSRLSLPACFTTAASGRSI